MRRRKTTRSSIALHRFHRFMLVRFNNVKAIKALISSGADLEERSREKAKPSRHGRVTALHVAAEYSNFEAAKLLLEAGADVNARTQATEAQRRCYALVLRSRE